MLTPDQERAFHAYEEHARVFISGPAGTGKSFLIHYIQEDCKKKNRPYLTLSSTGISAHHIDGMTVHSFLCRLRLKVIKPTLDTVFIVDECSMLGKKIFDLFETQLRTYASTDEYVDPSDRSSPFGNFKVVFFGDFAQLPPINDDFCFYSNAWYTITEQHELTTIMRQTEPEFQTFLSHVRTGKLVKSDKEKIMSLLRHPTDATTHLFLSNIEAEEFNKRGLETMVEKEHQEIVSLVSIITSTLTTEEETQFFKDQHHCYHTLDICIGAKCMLTSNIDVQQGWCNGTLATVHAITPKEIIIKDKKGRMCPIGRKLYQRTKQRIECDVIVSSDKKKKRYCGKTDCLHTPMYTMLDDDPLYAVKPNEHSKMMTVEQFPLLLAWGLTIHKSQGMSLESCAITLPYHYPPSLIYVALSRCISFERLSLRSSSPIRFDQIRPSEDVMRTIFGWSDKTCQLCNEIYMGPYTSFCQDCCSAPGKYSEYRFIDFCNEAMPSPRMMDYINYVLQNPDKASTKKWKKFVAFCKKYTK